MRNSSIQVHNAKRVVEQMNVAEHEVKKNSKKKNHILEYKVLHININISDLRCDFMQSDITYMEYFRQHEKRMSQRLYMYI